MVLDRAHRATTRLSSPLLSPAPPMTARSSTGETMPIKSNYLFVVSMDVDPDKEALFNEVYDSGEEKRITQDGPRYTAIYEIDGPHVLVSREWAQTSEAGRWPGEVRPYTRNRRHALYKLR
jgi:hypothetical protein